MVEFCLQISIALLSLRESKTVKACEIRIYSVMAFPAATKEAPARTVKKKDVIPPRSNMDCAPE
jgi:hypothetical protein